MIFCGSCQNTIDDREENIYKVKRYNALLCESCFWKFEEDLEETLKSEKEEFVSNVDVYAVSDHFLDVKAPLTDIEKILNEACEKIKDLFEASRNDLDWEDYEND